jgi:hypothetical protein
MKTTLIALVLTAPLLGGCHSIFAKRFGSKLNIRPIGNQPAPGSDVAYAVGQLEAGRKALDDGQVIAAIAAFRNARLYPDQTAAASNGLAVAYARLGRPDLAERYFREAVALAPGERRYQANLQRFYRLNPVELAMNASDRPAPAAAPSPAPETRMVLVSQTGAPTAVVVSQPRSRLVRLSAEEVRIGSAEPGSAATAEKPSSVTYPVRIGFAPREVHVGKAPSVMVAGRPRGAVQVAERRPYPLRVRITSR